MGTSKNSFYTQFQANEPKKTSSRTETLKMFRTESLICKQVRTKTSKIKKVSVLDHNTQIFALNFETKSRVIQTVKNQNLNLEPFRTRNIENIVFNMKFKKLNLKVLVNVLS